MSTGMIVGIVAIVIALSFFGFLIGIYNTCVRLRERVKNAFATIDTQLKLRYDLIPNLVEGVKKATSHESETLEAVIAARNGAQKAAKKVAKNPANPHAMEDLISAEKKLSSSLNVVFEAYPDLKANATIMDFQEKLTSIENKIAFARQAFNDAVMFFNTQIQEFPNNIIAGAFNFEQAEYFEIEDDTQREAVKVSFDS